MNAFQWRNMSNSLGKVRSRVVKATAAFMAVLLLATPGAHAESNLVNLSTRGVTGTGDDVLIGGLIIEGAAKTLLIRGIGPSLADFAVTGALADPELELFSGSAPIGDNGNWGDHIRANEIPEALRPSRAAESAMLVTLEPGAYTTILRGVSATTGNSLIEIYEIGTEGRLVNISTRGRVGTGDEVMIGGVVIQGDEPKTVVVRARGPSLSDFGVAGALGNPSVEIHSGGILIDANDDWRMHARAADIPDSLAPTNDQEAAIVLTVEPGAYTAIVRGVAGLTGVAVIEIFAAEARDSDGDGLINSIDEDDDNDGTLDAQDHLPFDPTETQDTDNDGIGDNADNDDDGDGVVDSADAFPLDAAESVDTDNDGTGNNADTDDDGDGVPDTLDPAPLDPAISSTSVTGLGGIWLGETRSGGTEPVVALSTADGEFRMFSLESFRASVSQLNDGSGNQVTGTGLYWVDYWAANNATLSGSLTPGAAASGSWASSGGNGSFTLDYSDAYENNPALSSLAGNWASHDETGASVAVFSVQSDGRFTGNAALGCGFSGQISIIDNDYSVYRVDVTISNCAQNTGTFQGLGAMVGAGFSLCVDNGATVIIAELLRN